MASYLLLILGISFITQISVLGSESALVAESSSPSITIQGNEMQYDTARNVSKVKGEARAEKGAETKKQILTADQFEVHFADKKTVSPQISKANQGLGEEQNIDTIVATGNVVLVSDDLVMKADTCVYKVGNPKDPENPERIECKHNVALTKGKQYLAGEEGKLILATGVYMVKKGASKNRVKAVLQSKEKTSAESTPSSKTGK